MAQTSGTRPNIGFIFAMAAVLAAALAGLYSLHRSHVVGQTARSEEALRHIAATSADRVGLLLTSIDETLLDLAFDIPRSEEWRRRDRTALDSFLVSKLAGRERLPIRWLVADDKGEAVAGGSGPPPRFSIKDRDYFTGLAGGGSEPYLGQPITSRITGLSVFTLARRLKTGSDFQGIVVAGIESEPIVEHFDWKNMPGLASAMQLVHRDNNLILAQWNRTDEDRDAVGRIAEAAAPFGEALRQGWREGIWHRENSVLVRAPVPGFPLDVMIEWNGDALVAAEWEFLFVAGGIVFLTMAGAGLLILRAGGAERRFMSERARKDAASRRLLARARMVAWEAAEFPLQATYVSPQAEETFGFPAEDWYREGFWRSRIHPDDRQRILEYTLAETEAGRDHELLYRIVAADGRNIWVRDFVNVARKADGRNFLSGLMIDVTDRQEALERARRANEILEDQVRTRTQELLNKVAEVEAISAELTQAKDKAEDASRQKTRFLAAASHDLRQPIQAAILYGEMIEGAADNDLTRGMAAKLTQSLATLRDLLNTLLDMSRLDAGMIRPQIGVVSLREIFATMAAEFQMSAAEKGISLRFAGGSLDVGSDRTLIGQILGNLIANAVKYTDRGKILVGARRRGNMAAIQVWDTGIGISREHSDQVFEEFFQIGNAERDRSRGLGLGLAIVKRLADLMGYPISLRSAPGKGTRVELLVPLAQPLCRPMPAPCAPLDVDLAGIKVGLIDDDLVVREALRDQMENWGCTVFAAASAEELIGKLVKPMGARIKIDILLADYRLAGGASGVAAIKSLELALGQRAGAGFGALLITGDTAPERLKQIAESGYPVLHKPITARDLRRALADAMPVPAIPA